MEEKQRSTKVESNLVELPSFPDERGLLVAIETGRVVPFAIERVYYIVGGAGQSRGFHAHRELEQLMICIAGSCRVVLDDGSRRSEHRLDRPTEGLFVGPMTWREMHELSHDCILLVLASRHYDGSDYIRDYDAFLDQVRRERGHGG